jgi:hypothetical protein
MEITIPLVHPTNFNCSIIVDRLARVLVLHIVFLQSMYFFKNK